MRPLSHSNDRSGTRDARTVAGRSMSSKNDWFDTQSRIATPWEVEAPMRASCTRLEVVVNAPVALEA